ncbi:Homeodomain protein [Pseudocohnilembus persalinus]|uniref:Homeodomain protein n=1 Tax=Pseudocohnilembus persalinus TaxID=266149 RepID=A0A0V0QGI7_PSEPJ|nr:Homeodomain protein [Pseudocohnilembus persalinus]|eukprot:KRX01300.1 Homeodomain protein [Pseudocohnilembus persalinus]
MPGKNAESCKFKWLQMSKVSSNRIPWTKKDNSVLKELVKQCREINGNYAWVDISKKLFKLTGEKIFRSSKQCREHYHNFLDPNLKNTKWTMEEDTILIQMQSQIGNKWSEIAKKLPGRTDNSVKNRFMSLKTKKLDTIEALQSYHSQKSIESSNCLQYQATNSPHQSEGKNQKIQRSQTNGSENLYSMDEDIIKQEYECKQQNQHKNIGYSSTQYQQSQFNQREQQDIQNLNLISNVHNQNQSDYTYQQELHSKNSLKKYNYEDDIYLESDDQNNNNNTRYQYNDNTINNNIQQSQNRSVNIESSRDQNQNEQFVSDESEETDEQKDVVNSMDQINEEIHKKQLPQKCSIVINQNPEEKEDGFTLLKNFENLEINDKWKPAYVNLETRQVILVNQQDYVGINNYNSSLSIQFPSNLSILQQTSLKKDFNNRLSVSSRRFSLASEQNHQGQQIQNNFSQRKSLASYTEQNNSHIHNNYSNNNINNQHHPLEGILVGFPYKSLDSIASINQFKDYANPQNNQYPIDGMEQENITQTAKKFSQRNSIQSYHGQFFVNGDINQKNMINSDQFDQNSSLQANYSYQQQPNFINNNIQQPNNMNQQDNSANNNFSEQNNLNQELQYLGIQKEHSYTDLNQADRSSNQQSNISQEQHQQLQQHTINEPNHINNSNNNNTSNKQQTLTEISMQNSPNQQFKQNLNSNNVFFQNYRRNSSLKQLNNFLAENYANNLFHKRNSKNSQFGGQISMNNINFHPNNTNQTMPKFSLESSAGIKAFQHQNNLTNNNQYQQPNQNQGQHLNSNQNQNQQLNSNSDNQQLLQQDSIITNNYQNTYNYLDNSGQNNNLMNLNLENK